MRVHTTSLFGRAYKDVSVPLAFLLVSEVDIIMEASTWGWHIAHVSQSSHAGLLTASLSS
jgi:hypothetical protein